MEAVAARCGTDGADVAALGIVRALTPNLKADHACPLSHRIPTAAGAVQAGGVMYYVQARVDPEPILAYRGYGVSNADWQQVT